MNYVQVEKIFNYEENMNYYKVLLLIALIFAPAYSQETNTQADEPKTLFGGKPLKSGGYGCPELKLTPINGNLGLMVGGRGGWIINSTFSIGGGGYGLVTNHKIDNYFKNTTNDTNVYLRVGYGGLYLSYINNSNEIIHFTVNALIGAGGAVYTPSYSSMVQHDSFGFNNSPYENSAFFVFEPGVGIEVNLLKFFRIELGASYRYISGLELTRTTSANLSGLSGNLAFKFGSF